VYENWMENIRDWNISRQLWWGHRVPVWYCDACKWQDALREDPASCPKCGGRIRQDEDVLDTWFSSWLWPLSTLGWPEETQARRAFYPGDVLVTAPEILFFWVARMIMSGFHFDGRPPFHTVLLNGTVRDMQHRKMSKSLGNGIDPLDVVSLYGADALRYTLIAGMGLGTDVMLDHESLERSFMPGRNFVTKLWNIGRFLLSNVRVDAPPNPPLEHLTRVDHWILGRLDAAIREADQSLGPARPPDAGPATRIPRWPAAERDIGMRLSEYVEAARGFVWSDLADWYLEHCKGRLAAAGDHRDAGVARATMVQVFDAALRLLHPVVPYVTEALWQRLPARPEGTLLARAAWPAAVDPSSAAGRARARAMAEYDLARAAVSAIRQIRADYGIGPGVVIDVLIEPVAENRQVYAEEAAAIGRLARCRVEIAMPGQASAGTAAATAVLGDRSTVLIPLAGVIDIEQECKRLKGELSKLDTELVKLRARLASEAFVSRAPADLVESERAKEREWSGRAKQLGTRVRALCPG